MGKVYLNGDNKLVVETDNGTIKPDGSTEVRISDEETYTISANEISMLLKIVNNQDIKISRFLQSEYYPYYMVISNEQLISDFEDLKRKMGDDIQTYRDKYDEIYEIKNHLEEKIKQYNSDRKIFWRPINIED